VEFELALRWSSDTWNIWRIHTCIECTFLAPFDVSLYGSFWRLKSYQAKLFLNADIYNLPDSKDYDCSSGYWFIYEETCSETFKLWCFN